MKHVYRYWKEIETRREGYSVADITFSFDWMLEENGKCQEYYGKQRKTLNAAINDAKRHYNKKPNEGYYGIYANAVLTEYYNDGTQRGKSDNDVARIGTLDPNGEYFDMCEQVNWMD